MKLYFLTTLLQCAIYLVNRGIARDQFWVSCRSVPGKIPGTIRIHSGEIIPRNTTPNSVHQNKTAVECYSLCTSLLDCRTAQLRTNSTWENIGQCEIYNKYLKLQANTPGYPIMRWKDCNFTSEEKCVSINDRRCRGMWVAYYDYKGLQSNYKYQIYQNFSSLNKAMDDCLKSIYCGSITYNSLDSVYLNVKWPDIKMTYEKGWRTFVWQCCKLEEKFDADCCKRGNCSYYWSINERGVKLNATSGRYVAVFQSLSSYHCRLECVRQRSCYRPLFNKTASVCVLEAKSTGCTEHNIFFPNKTLTYNSYVKINCSTNGDQTHETDTSMHHDDRCISILNGSDIEVYSDYCKHPYLFLKGRKVFANMSFYNLRERKSIGNASYWLVSTGLEILWLSIKGNVARHVRACDYQRCLLYDASIPKENSEIVSGKMWGSQKIINKAPKFKTAPIFVIIGRSLTPICSCFTLSSCSGNWRLRQEFYVNQNNDSGMPENFIVGSDGRIYESRGWKYFNNKVGVDYQGNAIAISFVGDTDIIEPSIKAVNAVKWLIQEGVKNKYISSSYTLLGYKDVSANSKQPGVHVYNIIQNWEAYKNRLLSNIPCPTLHTYWPYLLLGVLGIVSFVIVLLQRTDFFHRKACRIVRSKKTYLLTGYRMKLFPVINCDANDFENLLQDNVEIVEPLLLDESNENEEGHNHYYATPRAAVVYWTFNAGSCLKALIHGLKFALQGKKESVLPRWSYSNNVAQIVRHYLNCSGCDHPTFLMQIQPDRLAESESIILLFHGEFDRKYLRRFSRSPKCLCPPYRFQSRFVALDSDVVMDQPMIFDVKSVMMNDNQQTEELAKYRSKYERQVSCDSSISYDAFFHSPWMWKVKPENWAEDNKTK